MEKQYLINTPHKVSLGDYDSADTGGLDKNQGLQELQALEARLVAQQELLYGARQHAVLIVLQGMDTSGKDGTIKHVLQTVNPAGCQVSYFKEPTPEELAHDFLWRVHQRTPGKGLLGIFNRSHYEDVLVVRVHRLVPREVWEQRYEQINDFERILTQNETILLKFYLHISKDEQVQRLLAREKEPEKAWKLSVGDWQERENWGDYRSAYEDAISRCATKDAPWLIVPSDKKWYRDVFIARAIVERLEPYERHWKQDLEALGRRERAAIEEYRRQHPQKC